MNSILWAIVETALRPDRREVLRGPRAPGPLRRRPVRSPEGPCTRRRTARAIGGRWRWHRERQIPVLVVNDVEAFVLDAAYKRQVNRTPGKPDCVLPAVPGHGHERPDV